MAYDYIVKEVLVLLYFLIETTILFIVFVLLEKLRPIQKDQPLFSTEKKSEIGIFAISRVIILPITQLLTIYYYANILSFIAPYQLFAESIKQLHFSIQVIVGLLIIDLATYVRHRFTHKFMWPVHAIHHNAHDINWLTSQRLHPVEIIVAWIFDATFLYFLGFEGNAMVLASSIMYCFNILAHSNINFEWPGYMRYILGSPNFHRWHHAKYEKEAFDKNFCVMFPFIDYFLGTLYYPKHLPGAYGLYQRSGKKEIPQTLWAQIVYPFTLRGQVK